MNNKLQAKDLITVGISSAIYFVVFFALGMLGYVPMLFVLMPIYFTIFTAIPFMLFLTKAKKFGMVTINVTYMRYSYVCNRLYLDATCYIINMWVIS